MLPPLDPLPEERPRAVIEIKLLQEPLELLVVPLAQVPQQHPPVVSVARWQNLIPSFPWIAPLPSTLAQSKERKISNFAIWQPCRRMQCGRARSRTELSLLVNYECKAVNLMNL